MPSVSHYSPLNCWSPQFSFMFFFSRACLDVFHSDILSSAGQCACVVSHLMIPVWAAAKRKPLKSVEVCSSQAILIRTGYSAHFMQWEQLFLYYNDYSDIIITQSHQSWQLNVQADYVSKCLLCKVARMKQGIHSRSRGHKEWIITWDRCHIALIHRTRPGVRPFHASQASQRIEHRGIITGWNEHHVRENKV